MSWQSITGVHKTNFLSIYITSFVYSCQLLIEHRTVTISSDAAAILGVSEGLLCQGTRSMPGIKYLTELQLPYCLLIIGRDQRGQLLV